MPMHSALLGFAFFRSIQHHLSRPLSPSKTTLIEIIAGSLGLAPFMSGFTSFITALEFLATPEENGPTRFSFVQLLLWSIATCERGIVTGAGSSLQETFSSARAASLSLCNCYWHTDRHFVWERRNHCPRKSVKECVSRSEPSGPNLDRESPIATELVNEVDPADTGLPSDESTIDISQDDNGPAVNVLLLSLAGSLAFVCCSGQNFQTDSSTYEVAEFGLLLFADTTASFLVQSHCCQRISLGIRFVPGVHRLRYNHRPKRQCVYCPWGRYKLGYSVFSGKAQWMGSWPCR